MHESPETIDLQQALGIVRRRVPLIVLCALVVAGAALEYSKHQAKTYTATASLVFSTSSLSQQIAGLPAAGSGNLLAQQASDLEQVRLGNTAAKTASLLGHGLTGGQVSSDLSISGAGESGVVAVTATAPSPTLAAAIANTYARQFVSGQQHATSHYFKSALALVHRQLAALSPRQRTGMDGVALQNRAQTLGLLSELQYGNVQVAQEALAPAAPSAPKTSRNTVIGGVLGLLIGLALAFVLERTDRRIRGPEDLHTIYRAPLLGAVPTSKALARGARAAGPGSEPLGLPPAENEAFRLIRAHLRFFNVNRDLRTILIASPAAGDGKTTIAHHLAAVAARAGSRVLLLEVDLRNPTVAHRLGLPPEPGLTDVLLGDISMDEATRSIGPVGQADGEREGGTLGVLSAGAVRPPNPGELIESRAMEWVLEQARAEYDFVVIDAPPLTVVSDPFPLLGRVDGVVVVGWVGRSHREAAEQLHQILDSCAAPLLGVVANGSKAGTPGAGSYAPNRALAPTVVASNGTGPAERVPATRT